MTSSAKTVMICLSVAALAGSLLSFTAAVRGGLAREPRSPTPGVLVIDQDFPDPSILLVGNTWYAYGTTNGESHVQIARADAFEGPWTVLSKDALPETAPWVALDNPAVWAPDVVDVGGGNYVMYFSANAIVPAGTKASHCIGVATSNDPEGPFRALPDSLACPYQKGGAIDPAGFHDTSDDSYWVVYKIDGNNIGNGGQCNNGNPPLESTPIMLQRLNSARTATDGSVPIEILDRDDSDGPVVEAPSLNFKNGAYYLFFSSGCYSDDSYDTSYAVASHIEGPYIKVQSPNAPLFLTGNGLRAPGGADVDIHTDKAAFHVTLHQNPLRRGMRVISLKTENGIVQYV